MGYRTIRIDWLPRTPSEWATFTAVRLEAGRLWAWLIDRHAEARESDEKWPTRGELQKETKRKFPGMSSQSAQQTVMDFCESITSAESLRKRGEEYAYPKKKPRYRQVIFTNQNARFRCGKLSLPCGTGLRLAIRVPKDVEIPGRVMEVHLDYGSVSIVCRVDDEARTVGPTIGVDLGVNTLIAATDGEKAVLISGREVKATSQWRNKKLAEISSKQLSKKKGSRRHKRLQRVKYRTLTKTKNKIRDLCHKATRKVADAFPNAKVIVGKPFNDAARKINGAWSQTVSQACNRKLIDMLGYKLAEVTEVDEHYTSQTCPACGVLSKHSRTFRCRCGFEAPRDVVGALNIRAIGIDGEMQPGRSSPGAISFIHPSKYPRANLGSRADTTQVARARSRESQILSMGVSL